MRYARVHEGHVVEVGETPHRLKDIFVPAVKKNIHELPDDSPVAERWLYNAETGEFSPPPRSTRPGTVPGGSSS